MGIIHTRLRQPGCTLPGEMRRLMNEQLPCDPRGNCVKSGKRRSVLDTRLYKPAPLPFYDDPISGPTGASDKSHTYGPIADENTYC